MVLELRKHIKNIHTNKNTTLKLGKMAKGDENEVIVDVGQGFTVNHSRHKFHWLSGRQAFYS